VAQDLVIRPQVVDLRRERWLTAEGRMMLAPLPAGIDGRFGPALAPFQRSMRLHSRPSGQRQPN
jgi:hypothetical protein